MSNEKIREEFEKWVAERAADTPTGFYPQLTRRSVLDEGVYMISWVDSAWEGWQASRAAIEVELPVEDNTRCYTVAEEAKQEAYNQGLRECRYAIESLGLKVKP